MVDAGQQATLSAGPNMAYYRWRHMDESLISGGYTDSIKTVTPDQYISETRDKSGILPDGLTRDTIAVIERPSANNSARTLDFATTVLGVNYKMYKFQPAAAGAPMSKAPSESAVDSAWVEVPSLSFVGDGNPRSV
jgi:predicted Zn-dependent protease